MSAIGFLTAPLAFDFVRSWPGRLDTLDWQKANDLLNEMEVEGAALLEQSGVSPAQIRHQRAVDIRYAGQGHEIQVPLPGDRLDSESIPGIVLSFEETYRRLYERLSESVPLEIINWRVTSSSPPPLVRLHAAGVEQASTSTARKGSRRAYFPELGGYVDTPVYNRYGLSPGMGFDGPAIIEERESTVIVGPDCRFRIDEQLNLIVELEDDLP